MITNIYSNVQAILNNTASENKLLKSRNYSNVNGRCLE